MACARERAGEVRCWGGNSVGELGHFDAASLISPTARAELAGVALDVAAADQALCAILDDGVSCWGSPTETIRESASIESLPGPEAIVGY